MASRKVANYIFFSGLLVIALVTLPQISAENIDCKGKAFHCVNSTHFKICVDLGGGVSKTVDEFLIPCPRSTACNDINKFECEYQVTTTLPSTQQSDVLNDLVDLGTTLSWDNIDVNEFSPENVTYTSSAVTTETSYLITEDITTSIPSTTLDETLNQVNSSSANNINITSYTSDSETVTNTYDVLTVNTNVSLNDTLNSTLNKSVTVISGDLFLSKTVQGSNGATEFSIDVSELNNANTYDNNKEYGYTINLGTLTLSKIVENPISYSNESTSFSNDSYTSTTPVSVLSNLEINSNIEDILKTTSQYTGNNNKSLKTETSESLIDTKLNISENINSSDNNTKDTLSKATTNAYNEWEGFTINIVEQNNFIKTENLFTSFTELSFTNSVESSTERYRNADLTTPTTKNNDWQNSENIETSPRYTTDLYTVSEFQNNSADVRISPTIDNEITKVENKSDVINVLNLADSLPVTDYVDILSEVVRSTTITANKSLSKDILTSNSPLQIEISEKHFSNLTDTTLKTPNASNLSALNDIPPISDIKDTYFVYIHENNVTNHSIYKDAIEGLSIDKPNFNNSNEENLNSINANNNNTAYFVENTSVVITSTAGFYKTSLAVEDAAFTFVTSPPLSDTNPVNTTTTQYISIPEYHQPTTIANRKINENLAKPSSSDLNLDINKSIPCATAARFHKDNKDSMSLNKIFFSTNENMPLTETTTINTIQESVTFQNEGLNIIKNKIIGNSTVKTEESINLSNVSFDQLNLNSSELTTLNDNISIHPFKIQVNNSKNSLNETNLRVPDITNSSDIIYTTNKEVQSNVNQAVTEILYKVSSTENSNLINVNGSLDTTFPIQTQTLIQLKPYENRTNKVNTKNIDDIGTNEASTAAVSSIIPKTSYKEPKEIYSSVTSLILGTTKPYIYKKENISITDPSIYINAPNHSDQQNTSNSNVLVYVGNLDSGSTLHNSSENMSKIQDLNVSNNKTGFHSEDSFRSTPFQMKITTSPFQNNFNVDSTLDLPSNPKNLARTTSHVGILENNANNSISATSSLGNNNQTVFITTNKINAINNEVLIGTLNNVTLAQNIDKIKSDLTSADVSIDSKNSSNLELKSTSNLKQVSNDNALQYNVIENNVNIIPVLSKTNNSTGFLKQNEAEINETLKLLQANLNLTLTEINVNLSNNIVKNQRIPTTTVESLAIKLINSPHADNQTTPLEQFTCVDRGRGKYSDKSNCNKFYICIGKLQPIIGMCPEDTVFSEIRKQCTSNLSHCIRNNQFRCLSSGRFIDILSDIFYYICVKKRDSYVRYKLQCQKGYHLNKENIQCSSDTASIENNSNTTSDKSTNEVKSEDISQSANYETVFECEKEGKFEHPGDCRKYFICSKSSKSKFRRKIKKCSSDEVYNKEKGKCVDADSDEC